jgi:hypothetical protein
MTFAFPHSRPDRSAAAFPLETATLPGAVTVMALPKRLAVRMTARYAAVLVLRSIRTVSLPGTNWTLALIERHSAGTQAGEIQFAAGGGVPEVRRPQRSCVEGSGVNVVAVITSMCSREAVFPG